MDNPAPNYVVVARRYRPQQFEQLVGQEHVGRALSNAIASGRIGHAYLFTGARGVGKTSTARIFAKCLNCQKGLSANPCNECDICQAVSAGADVDVLEIDGASNRGIDEIRQLRQNVGVRPSRARFKIYIIDEVHMLTKEAFNALLKTLEEPPEHVKFIFCTTEPEKVPVTVLSRCQRFDFAGIQAPSIVGRLQQIVEAEGVKAEPQALEIIARRAAGSMRDSQSLLEQLLAFGGDTLTVADVHRLLGTADSGRMASLLEALLARDSGLALRTLDAALAEGVDVGQIMDQLLGVLRDVMVACVGASPEEFLFCLPSEAPTVLRAAQALNLETVLAMLQIVDQTLARMRVSTQRRTLAELALARICRLDALRDLSGLLEQMRGALRTSLPGPPPAANPAAQQAASAVAPAAAELKKNGPRAEVDRPPAQDAVSLAHTMSTSAPDVVGEAPLAQVREPPTTAEHALPDVSLDARRHAAAPAPIPAPKLLSPDSLAAAWRQIQNQLSPMMAASVAQCHALEQPDQHRVLARFPAGHEAAKQYCEAPDQRAQLEQLLEAALGCKLRLDFAVDPPSLPPADAPLVKRMTRQERLRQVSQHALVRRAAELLGARLLDIDEPK